MDPNPDSAPEKPFPDTLGGNGSQAMTLTARVVKGVGWVFAGKVVGRTFDLIKIIVLARLLTPHDFGLFGIVLLGIAVLETFSKTGFDTALIQRKDDIKKYLDTAWTVQAIRGLILAGVLFAISPAIGWFFNEPRTITLLRVMCVTIALEGFVNIGIIYFTKELEFHKLFIYNLVPAAIGLIIGVALAFHLRSVWALIWAGLAGSLARCVLSYIIHPYRPRPRFDGTQAIELFRFGRWMLGSSVILFLATCGDDVFLGKMLGASALGFYQIAYRLSNTPATEITHFISTIMMPAYAKVQDEKVRLGRAFLNVLEVVMSLALPLTTFIFFAAPEIILGILGIEWSPAIIPLQILALAGLFRAIAAMGGPVFIGAGHPHLDFWMNLGRVIVIAITIYPLTRIYGVSGTSFSVVLGLASTFPVWRKVKPITGVTWREILKRCQLGFILAFLVPLGIFTGRLLPAKYIQVTLLWQTLAVAVFLLLGVWMSSRLLGRSLYIQAVVSWSVIKSAQGVNPKCGVSDEASSR